MTRDTKVGIIGGIIVAAICALFILCDARPGKPAGNVASIGDAYIPPTVVKK